MTTPQIFSWKKGDAGGLQHFGRALFAKRRRHRRQTTVKPSKEDSARLAARVQEVRSQFAFVEIREKGEKALARDILRFERELWVSIQWFQL